jgi:hypothetical protein
VGSIDMPTLPPDYAHVCTYYHHCARTHAHVHKIYLSRTWLLCVGRQAQEGANCVSFVPRFNVWHTLNPIISNPRQWQKDRADSPAAGACIVSAEFVSLEICWVHPQLTLYSHSCIYVCMYVCSVCVCMCVCVYVCKYPSMQSLSLALADAVQSFLYTCIVCMHACMYVYIVCMYCIYCMYPCMCISVCLYIYV